MPPDDFRRLVDPESPSVAAVGFVAAVFIAVALVGSMMLADVGWAEASPPSISEWRTFEDPDVGLRMLYPPAWFMDVDLPEAMPGDPMPIVIFVSPPARGGDTFRENLVVLTHTVPETGLGGLLDQELVVLDASDVVPHERMQVTVGEHEAEEMEYSATYATPIGPTRLRQRIWAVSLSPPSAVVFVYTGEAEYNEYLRYAEAMIESVIFP